MAQPTINVQAPLPSNTLPEMRNRVGWWAFIAGGPELEWNPPKKPNVNKGKKFGKGMRGFADEEDWQGEFEGVIAEASLPTPHGTPSPSDQPPEDGSRTPREPTPTMLRLIDEVRLLTPSPRYTRAELYHAENRLPSSEIFHSLDRIVSSTTEAHRNPRKVDVRSPYPNQRLRFLRRHEPPAKLRARLYISPRRPRTKTCIFWWARGVRKAILCRGDHNYLRTILLGDNLDCDWGLGPTGPLGRRGDDAWWYLLPIIPRPLLVF